MSREKALAKNTLILSIGTFLPKFAALITIPVFVMVVVSKNHYL